MSNYHEPPTRAAGGPRRGASGERWEVAFHATREEHIRSILERGLLPGGDHNGVMRTSSGMVPWPNVVYDLHPVFVFLEPSYREDVYRWESAGAQPEVPIWLRIDVGGLMLYPDLWELREVTQAWAAAEGFWWGLNSPEVEGAPALLRPFVEQDGVLTYDSMFDVAAAAAIETSRSAAILAPIAPHRMSVLTDRAA